MVFMKSKRGVLAVLGTCFALTVAAQGYKCSAVGAVRDSLTGDAEPFVTVRLSKPGSPRAVAVATSDENGHFRIGTNAAGSYELQVVAIGKKPVSRRVDLSAGARLDLGTLLLQEYSATFGEATVTAQRPIVKAEVDRVAYSMADDPDAQTNSLLDMLRKVPMVQVDGEDNIQVNGSSSFKVYVNGKPNQMMSANPSLILKNYPASAIKKVEVITDPGAKYDAEGVSGILNIVTDADTKTSGYTLIPNIRLYNRGLVGNLFGMAQFGNLIVSANYGIGRDNQPERTTWSEREAFGDATNHLLRSDGVSDGHGTFQFGSLDASYEFDEKNLLSVSAGLSSWHGTDAGHAFYRMENAAGGEVYRYRLDTRGKSKYDNYNVSTDFQHTFAKDGPVLTLSYRFSTSPSGTPSATTYSESAGVPYDLKDLQTDPDNRSTEHTAQADFTAPLGKHHTFATGLKYIYRLNKSDSYEASRPAGTDEVFAKDDDRSINYRHRGDIAAAYGEYTLKAGAFTTRAGLRYEYSRFKVSYPDGKAAAFSTDFNDLVPSLNFSYGITETRMVKAGYNMRIGRPGISELSPYVSRPTAESQSYGNPNLDSEKAHNFMLGYSTFGPKLSFNATLTYMVQTDGMTAYSFLDDHNVMTTTYGNLSHTKNLRLSTYVNWTIVNGTVLNVNAGGSYADYKAYRYYNGANAHNSGFAGDLFGSLRQALPWKFKLSLHGGGMLKRPALQGQSAGFYFYGFNLSRSFLPEERLTLSVSAQNFICPERKFANLTVTDLFRSESRTRVDIMRFSIGVRYRLGGLKAAVKKVQRTIENSDVRQQQPDSGTGISESGTGH